jgi:drug/metabolite transporter (DMT)-like permease
MLNQYVKNFVLFLKLHRGHGRGMADSRTSASAGFAAWDWALLAAVAVMWGSSFLLIKVGVHSFSPATVAWLRLLFGVALLSCFPAARKPLRRADRAPVALLGLVWMAGPFVLFPLAERSIPSALAGTINGAAPLFTAAIAALWSRRMPGRGPVTGLVVGLAGVVAVDAPAVGSGSAGMLGIGLVLLATVLYGVAYNLTAPLEDRNGALAIIWRAELAALAVDTPAGLAGLAHSSATLGGLLAMAVLGAVCTGLAFAAFATLVGRVGATRGSVTVYLVPVVAIVLGVAVNGEPVQPVSLAGIALVLAGAYLTSRPNQPPSQTGREQAAGSPPAAADPARRPAPRPEDSPPQRRRCSPRDQAPASSGSPDHFWRQRLDGSSPGPQRRSAPCWPATGRGRPAWAAGHASGGHHLRRGVGEARPSATPGRGGQGDPAGRRHLPGRAGRRGPPPVRGRRGARPPGAGLRLIGPIR